MSLSMRLALAVLLTTLVACGSRQATEPQDTGVACDGEACTVKLMLTYDHPKMKGIVTPVVESWIVDGAQAWPYTVS